jgi:hypothetical protein
MKNLKNTTNTKNRLNEYYWAPNGLTNQSDPPCLIDRELLNLLRSNQVVLGLTSGNF